MTIAAAPMPIIFGSSTYDGIEKRVKQITKIQVGSLLRNVIRERYDDICCNDSNRIFGVIHYYAFIHCSPMAKQPNESFSYIDSIPKHVDQ